MMRAIFSLPAPFGPVISTGTSAAATWTARSTSRAMASLWNTSPQRSGSAPPGRPRAADSVEALALRSPLRRASRIASSSRTLATSRASSHGLPK